MRNLSDNQQDMYQHFSKVSARYNEIRATDLEPIMFIQERCNDNQRIEAVDIGAGSGRYCLKLFKHLDNLYLTCIDINAAMLEETSNYLSKAGITGFRTIQSPAEDIPLDDNSIDYIFVFNAIHHLNLTEFTGEAARVLRDRGSIFIYTRLQSQNGRNIWGRYFPLFLEKEERLYELDDLERMIALTDSLYIECTKGFKYRRKASLKRLVDLAGSKHYSTFSLYQQYEFETALKGFEDNIKKHFSNLEKIEWDDEYTMLVVKKFG